MQALKLIDSIIQTIDQNEDKSLKITSIELYLTSLGFVNPYMTAIGRLVDQTNVVCKINTNNDKIFGYGEACPVVKFTSETTDSVWKITRTKIASLIKNKDPLMIDEIEQLLDQNVDDSNVMAKGMINMALWDIYGKYYNKPVYKCLIEQYGNGDAKVYNKKIPLLYPFGDQTIEEDTKLMTEKMKQGYRTFMLKMGANMDMDYQIERVKNVEKKFGPIGKNVFIVADANQGYTYEQSLKFIRGCKGIKLSFFEQPIKKTEYDKLKLLKNECNKNGFDLSLDESVQDMKAINYSLDNEIGNVFSVKVSKNGGITKLYKVAKMCKAKGVKCLFNSMLEYGISQASLLSVIAVTENIVEMGHCFMSTLRFNDDITNFRSLVSSDKIVSLSDEPGLGIIVSESKLASYSSKIEKF